MALSLMSRCTLAVALLVLTLLGACSPGGHAGGSAAHGAAPAPAEAALAADLDRIERALRARPQQYELELRARSASTPAGSAAQLDVLALRGLLAAHARNRPLVSEISQQLREWPCLSSLSH